MVKESNTHHHGGYTVSAETPPPIGGMGMERIDYTQLKRQLNTALKTKADLYWDTLKQYFSGHMTKRELDHFVGTYLTESNIKLHNNFIKAMIFNSFYAKTPPTQQDAPKTIVKKKILTFQLTSTKDKEKSDGKEKRKEKKRSSTTDSTATAGTSSSSSKAKKTKSSSRRPKLGSSSSSIDTSSGSSKEKRSHPKYSLLYSPEVQALKDRMETIAFESGLGGVSRQSVIYMMLSLERHIRDIVYNSNPNQSSGHHKYFNSNLDSLHLSDLEDIDDDDESIPPNQRHPPQYLAYQYDDIKSSNIKINHPSTSQLTLRKHSNIIEIDSINNDNNKTAEKEDKMDTDDKQIDTTNNNNNNNNSTTTTTTTTTTSTSTTSTNSITPTTTTTLKEQLAMIPNPNYFMSKNPLLSFSIPVYKIPDNLFSSTLGKDEYDSDDQEDDDDYDPQDSRHGGFVQRQTLTSQDIYTTIELNPYILGEDTLNFERINLSRFK